MRKGFTLTELIIVIVIIGILAAVLIPTLTQYIGRSQQAADEEEARSQLTVLIHDAILAVPHDNAAGDADTYNKLVNGKVYLEGARGYRMYFKGGKLEKTEKVEGNTPLTGYTKLAKGTETDGVYVVVSGNPAAYDFTVNTKTETVTKATHSAQ